MESPTVYEIESVVKLKEGDVELLLPPVLELPPDDQLPPVWFPPDDELPPVLLEEMEMYVFFCTQDDDDVHNLTYAIL